MLVGAYPQDSRWHFSVIEKLFGRQVSIIFYATSDIEQVQYNLNDLINTDSETHG